MSDKLQYQFDFLTGKNDVSKTVASLQSGISGFVKGAAGAVAGVVAVVAAAKGLSALFSESIDAASEQENAIQELNTALAMTGQFSKQASEEMQSFASTMQNTTKYADDAVLGVSSLIQNLARLDTQGLKRATKASLDLATALRIDVETAATMVGKAAQGNIATFQRYGLEIKKGATDTETFANTLKILEERFGGASEAAMNTFSGSLAGVKNAFGDVLERIGNIIVKNPAVIKLFQVLKGVMIELEKVLGQNQDALIELVQGGIVSLINALSVLIKIITPVVNVLGVLGSVALMAGRGIIQLLQVLSKFEVVQTIINSFAGTVVTAFSLITKTVGLAIKGWMEIINIFPSVSKQFKDMGLNADSVIKTIDDLNDSVSKLGEDLYNNKYKVSGFLSETEKDYKNFEEAYRDSLVSVIKSLNIAGLNTEDLANKISKLKIKSAPDLKNIEQNIESTFNKIKEGISGLGVQALTAFTQGKQGAIKLAGALASAVGVAFLGPMGQALGPIAELFAQGPDQVRAMINEFLSAIPEIIKNISLSIPVFIQAIADKLPEIVDALIMILADPAFWIRVNYAFIKASTLLIPRLLEGIVKGMRDAVTNIIQSIGEGLSREFVKSAEKFTQKIVEGAGKFVEEIIKKVSGGVSGTVSKIGGGIGNVISSIGGVFGFAKGGHIKSIPAGYPNDSYPINVQSGELIVDSNTTSQLKNFLNGGGNDVMIGLLNAILNELRNPMRVETSVQLNNQTLADIILNLNRNNARLV